MESLPSQPPALHIQSPYRIRRCTDKADADHLYTFVCELADCAGKLDRVTQTRDDYIRDGWNSPNPLFYAAFAEHQNEDSSWKPVGYVVWYFAYSTWIGKTLFVEDLYVRDNHRRNGLGKKLFSLCVKNAQDNNCAHVEWVVLRWNERARAMYESFGGEYPDNGVWELMKLDEEAIANFMKYHYKV